MNDQSRLKGRGGSWRGRLTVLGLFALGLLAILVLRLAITRVASPPPGTVPSPTTRPTP